MIRAQRQDLAASRLLVRVIHLEAITPPDQEKEMTKQAIDQCHERLVK